MVQRLSTNLIRHKGEEFGTAIEGGINMSLPSIPRENASAIHNRDVTRIKVATWNVWGLGAAGNYGSNESAVRQRDIKERLLNAQLDYCGLQECYYNYQAPIDQLARFPFTSAFHGVVERWSDWKTAKNLDYGPGAVTTGTDVIHSNYVYTRGRPTASHQDKEERGFTKTISTIRGHRIAFFNTHLSYEGTRFPEQMAELTQQVLLSTEDKVVVMGDFNHDRIDLFQPLIDAGFGLCHNRELNSNNSGSTWYIDNILYRGFRRRIDRGVQVCERSLADHNMVYVELEV